MVPETRWNFRLLRKTFRSMSMYLDINRALKEYVIRNQQIVEIMAWFLSGCKFRCRWGKEIKFEARGKSEDWGLLPFIANCRQLLDPGHWWSLFKKHFGSLFDLMSAGYNPTRIVIGQKIPKRWYLHYKIITLKDSLLSLFEDVKPFK